MPLALSRRRAALAVVAAVTLLTGLFVVTTRSPADAALTPALAGQAGHRLVGGERRHARLGGRRRQHRHPLVQRVQRPAVDPGRPGRARPPSARSCSTGRPRTRARTRSRSRPTRPTWTTIYSTTTGTGGTQTLTRHRHRPVRADERHRARPPPYGYSLWEFQVYGAIGAHRRLRHGQRGAEPAGDRVLGGERRHARLGRRRRQHRHPLVQRVQRPAVAAGRPGRHGQRLPGGAELGGGVRARPSRSRSPPTRHGPGRTSTPPPPAPAARRPSTSPAPAATCG